MQFAVIGIICILLAAKAKCMNRLLIVVLFITIICLSACHRENKARITGPIEMPEIDPAMEEAQMMYCVENFDSNTYYFSRHIIKVITMDSIEALAEMMPYPIYSGYPPIVNNRDDFMKVYGSYFHNLSYRYRATPVILSYDNLYWLAGGVYLLGLFRLSGNRITYFQNNHIIDLSAKSEWLRNDTANLYRPLRNETYRSVLLSKVDSAYLRIDMLYEDYRLAIWPKNTEMNSAPLITVYTHSDSVIQSLVKKTRGYKFQQVGKVYYYYQAENTEKKWEPWLNIWDGKVLSAHKPCEAINVSTSW